MYISLHLCFIFMASHKKNNVSRSVFLSFLISLLFVLRLAAQNDLLLDETVFSCVSEPENISLSLDQGAQSFIFNIDKTDDLSTIITRLDPIISLVDRCNAKIIMIAFTGNYDKERMISKLKTKFKDQLFYRENTNEWLTISSLTNQGKKVVALFNDDLACTSAQIIKNEKAYNNRFTSNPLNKIIVFEPENPDSLYQNAITLWKRTGKVPNLVLLPNQKLKSLDAVIDSINKTRRFIGVVLFNNEYLNEIHWKQLPGLITPGRFSYPVLNHKEILSPYKNGYKITPGEIIQHTAMKDVPRTFNAYESSLDDQLVMYFPFDGSVQNLMEPKWDRIISKDVSFIKDPMRGKVVQFSKLNSLIDYSKENKINFDLPVSITVWIKPDSLPSFMGIIGIGTSFSLKLSRGRPDFTTAEIKDHLLDDTLEVKKWHHLGVVFNPGSTVEFFINGVKTSVLNASEIKTSDQSLIVGNNIWSEQFFGSMDELKIWNRGLSEKEILEIYNSKYSNSSSGKLIYSLVIAVVLIFIGFSLYAVNSRRRKNRSVQKNLVSSVDSKIWRNKVELFGNFHIYSENEGDISSRFSPLLRQMLSFFILNAYEKSGGVSIKKLTDTFWPGAPIDKAKENRGTNLKKLRKILEIIDGLNIAYVDKKWFLEINDRIFVDILEFKKLKADFQKQMNEGVMDSSIVIRLLEILKEGNILTHTDSEWLDAYKNSISTEVIDLLTQILLKLGDKQPHLQIEIAKTILKFDDLNEKAFNNVLIILNSQGKHGQARQVYDEFVKRYALLYNEGYPMEYQEIIKNQ